jgi:D-aspartate ligase
MDRDIIHYYDGNPPTIVLCLSPTGLSVARSLAPRGVAVYGIDNIRWEIGHFSRWVRHVPEFAFLPPGDDLLRALITFGKVQKKRPVIFNAGDPYIDFISHNHKALEEYYILTDSMCTEVNSIILNKKTFYTSCQELNIPVPLTFFPEDESDVKEIAKYIRYPAIVKPVHGHITRTLLRGKKLIEVNNKNALFSWWLKIKDWGTNSVLQEVIEGPESNIVVAGLYMDRAYRCRSLFTGRKLRQYPPVYGSGSYMESEWLPEVADLSINILQALKYHGVCGTEFKWDIRDCRWKLIEINCRPTLWFALTRAAGIDVVWDAYCDLIGRPNNISIGTQKNGVRWQLWIRDIASCWYFLRRRELSFGEFVSTAIYPGKKIEGVLSLNDWKANCAYILNTVMQYYSHFIKKGSRYYPTT